MQSDRDKNGKSISGSKQQKVWDYIDQMDLTSAQKERCTDGILGEIAV